jgi:predicted metal-dependent peptidase
MSKLSDADTLATLHQAMRLVRLTLPHLSELTGVVRLQLDRRVGTAGVFASGRLLVNPDFMARLDVGEQTFVLAHELLHLALRTHERGQASDPRLVNVAHDYIINDMLAHELGRPVPADGLHRPGARMRSLEQMVAELARDRDNQPAPGWPSVPGEGSEGDVLPDELERTWFPEADGRQQQEQAERVRQAAAQANRLGALREAGDRAERSRPGSEPGRQHHVADAVRLNYQPPWEKALQRWIEAAAVRSRSFARPSRRGQRRDVVLPGRQRSGLALHIVLDCSGSMYEDLSRALGAIATFCDGSGVDAIHVVQCDVEVTKDEWLTPDELARYEITGLGGTDLSPALRHLAEDPEVEAVVVLSDEDVLWAPLPPGPLPYDVLWVLMRPVPEFQPPFGSVIPLDFSQGAGTGA